MVVIKKVATLTLYICTLFIIKNTSKVTGRITAFGMVLCKYAVDLWNMYV